MKFSRIVTGAALLARTFAIAIPQSDTDTTEQTTDAAPDLTHLVIGQTIGPLIVDAIGEPIASEVKINKASDELSGEKVVFTQPTTRRIFNLVLKDAFAKFVQCPQNIKWGVMMIWNPFEENAAHEALATTVLQTSINLVKHTGTFTKDNLNWADIGGGWINFAANVRLHADYYNSFKESTSHISVYMTIQGWVNLSSNKFLLQKVVAGPTVWYNGVRYQMTDGSSIISSWSFDAGQL
ncbi:hypothetical protein VD0002_g2375 [Verticillium dahliae]|uniref:Uncharacterized protein n=1 Tax=Verticillium dahliae TaxID=27337 RepID=A0AA45AH58_VERDA|nr:hypothetical protein EV126DRAFT_437376 [Verticillium dahliae]KAH6680108.1 hypothetical protein EV126DRAFT_435141 [Verticillium dahliae]PNH26494.1 hypothetical protein BJF96_g10188 [Verticillium dahliae]PNH53262.1 hypothetical protein VD0003_g4153 [Verticillium dahliae]PNH67304.1 hypothetical protein VD0002_g2375 [Verticillium dahliae]